MELYKKFERLFEKFSGIIFPLLGNSIIFIIALSLTVFWFCTHDWTHMTITDIIRDVMLSITFLSFFIIQRTFLHFSQALHLKLNELVVAHDKARNHIINAEEKTSEEIKEMAKEHSKISDEKI